MWFTPELVQAIGIAVASVIGAITAWQAREVKKLRQRVDALEAQAEEDHRLFRLAGKVIRGLLADQASLLTFIGLHLPGVEPPTMRTEIPRELDEKI